MFGIIGVEGLRISCIIGDRSYEREKEQLIIVDLEVEVDLDRCLQSKEASDGVDYVKLAELCRQCAVNGKHRLLEELADEVLTKIVEAFSVRWARIKIKKPGALPSAKCASVELKRVPGEKTS